MGWFSCYGSWKQDKAVGKACSSKDSVTKPASTSAVHANSHLDKLKYKHSVDSKKEVSKDERTNIAAHTFTFRELAAATKNFRPECLIGEGGFGRVYKGRLESTGQIVAVKQLDRRGLQGNREFLVEVLMLSLLHHPNLVNLIGYCADGDQRLLVYEFMPLGSLEDHLHELSIDKESLDWNARMRIAAGAARGLEYLHDRANPPVIYRDFKSSNILLGEGFHPKLSDFGLAKLGPVGDKTHVSTRVMGTYGYCAPEYAKTGQLTLKSDVYSFGVVLLELITGRKAIDHSRATGEHNLVAWARPLFKDRRKFSQMVDPRLQGRFPIRGLFQALAVAAMCLQEDAATRPLVADVVTALNFLASATYESDMHPTNSSKLAPFSPREKKEKERKLTRGSGDERVQKERTKRRELRSPAQSRASPDFLRRDTYRCRSNASIDAGSQQEGVHIRRRDGIVREDFGGPKGSPRQLGQKTSVDSQKRDRASSEAKFGIGIKNGGKDSIDGCVREDFGGFKGSPRQPGQKTSVDSQKRDRDSSEAKFGTGIRIGGKDRIGGAFD